MASINQVYNNSALAEAAYSDLYKGIKGNAYESELISSGMSSS